MTSIVTGTVKAHRTQDRTINFTMIALGWRNRERVINALARRGLIDGDEVTTGGRQLLEGLKL